MKKDSSCGIIPLRIHHDEWQILLIQHHSGHWGFPKGHPEIGETPLQTAKRELNEETGLIIESLLSSEYLVEHYFFTFHGHRVSKTVHYYIALVTGNLVIQEIEIKNSQWVSLPQAFDIMTFKEGKRLCFEVTEFLKSFNKIR
ncbi:MAG: bis(5'-nucleosyl)-tetraphosphatase [Parachlamydiaceae bacterium]